MRTITGKKKLGGLSRKKDYGSDKKPYPSVKSKRTLQAVVVKLSYSY